VFEKFVLAKKLYQYARWYKIHELLFHKSVFKRFSTKNFVGNTKFEANSLFLIFDIEKFP